MACGRTFLLLLSPHRFHPFDVSNPILDGQGQAWITAMDYSTSYSQQGEPGRMGGLKYDYIRVTETIYYWLTQHVIKIRHPIRQSIHRSCGTLAYLISVFSPHGFQKAFQSASYHASSDNCHGTRSTPLQRPTSRRLISTHQAHTPGLFFSSDVVHFKAGCKHRQKDASVLPRTEKRRYWREGKSAHVSYLQYTRSSWPSFAYASVCLGHRFLPALLPPCQ